MSPWRSGLGSPQLQAAAPGSYLEPYGPATAVTQGAHARHQVALQPLLKVGVIIRVLRVQELLLWEGRQGKDRIRAVITISGWPPNLLMQRMQSPGLPARPIPIVCLVPSPAVMTSMGTVWHSSRRSAFSRFSFTFLLSVREGSCRHGGGQRSHLPATSPSSASLLPSSSPSLALRKMSYHALHTR